MFLFGKKLEINAFHSLKFKHKIIDQTGGFVGYFIAFVPGAVSPRPSRSPDIGDIQNERGVSLKLRPHFRVFEKYPYLSQRERRKIFSSTVAISFCFHVFTLGRFRIKSHTFRYVFASLFQKPPFSPVHTTNEAFSKRYVQ